MDNRIRLALDEIRNVFAQLSEIPVNAEVADNIGLNASPANSENVINQNLHGDFLSSLEQALEDLNRPLPRSIQQNESDDLQIPSTSHAADHTGQHGGNFNLEVAVSSDQIET
ncbi:hypothetical protein GOODEAATRI_032274 [Goodea atripinnis]|uniref:Uncharacterized protein n=1 Tax=Goodea atripinnis TaxID=208336 RepID=A0ABV0PIY4_9TELE